MIEKILVPYDFTNFADTAFEDALEIAKKFEAKLVLLTIIGSDIDTSGMSYERAQKAQDENENNAKNELDEISKSKDHDGVDVSISVIHNPSIIDGILSFVQNNDVDLIVMGSHGRSGLKKLVLGSVASGIVTKAMCRVMIVKPKN